MPHFKSKKIRNDFLLILGILIMSLVTLLCNKAFQKNGQYVSIIIDGKEENCFSLNEEIEHTIISGDNDEYFNQLIIKDNKAYVTDANCRDGICVEHKPVNKSGETIVCLPHKLVISIESDR